MAEILIANTYLLALDPKQERIGKPFPPLATIQAAANLRADGYDVALWDANLEPDVRGLQQALVRHAPAVLALYDDSFHWLSKMCLSRMREATWKMAEMAHARGVRVVVNSSDASDHAERYLAHGADCVIAGEGDAALRDVAGIWIRNNARSLREVASLVLREDGGIVRTPRRPVLSDLDLLPLPAWDLVDMDRYRTFWRRRHGIFALNQQTTRGCSFACNWCSKPVWGQAYHSRSPAHVLAETKLLRDRYAPDELWFCDDILGLRRNWLVEWSDRVASEGLVVPFSCQTRADLMTEHNVAALAKAGAREIWIGAESGSQRVLDAMDKGTTVEEIRVATRRLRAAKVRVAWFIQFGYPGETRADIDATRRLICEELPDDIGISVSYPLPGTPFHARVRDALGAKTNWVDSGDLDLMFPGPYRPDFYKALHRLVHAELRVTRGLRGIGTLRRPRALASLIKEAGALPARRALVEVLQRMPHTRRGGGEFAPEKLKQAPHQAE